ncbi:MAG: guanylate kinase [Actinomycetota bacterium]|nr:guanylate kinase [Actinomycetota bacterium]
MSARGQQGPRGVLLVLAGTSGAGKGTIGRMLLAAEPSLHWSVSWATRPARPGEVDGVDYHFRTHDEFERLRDAGGFLESFDVYGDLKGTPREPIERWLAAGEDVLLEVDVQGALRVKQALPEALLVFVQTRTREEQRRRLLERAHDTPEAIELRLARAEEEERIAAEHFDAVVINDDPERAAAEVAGILAARRSEPR